MEAILNAVNCVVHFMNYKVCVYLFKLTGYSLQARKTNAFSNWGKYQFSPKRLFRFIL